MCGCYQSILVSSVSYKFIVCVFVIKRYSFHMSFVRWLSVSLLSNGTRFIWVLWDDCLCWCYQSILVSFESCEMTVCVLVIKRYLFNLCLVRWLSVLVLSNGTRFIWVLWDDCLCLCYQSIIVSYESYEMTLCVGVINRY